jgi:hypothetical protein
MLAVAQGADQRHDVEAELMLWQSERALGLRTVGLVEAGAALRLAAADLEAQPHRAGERDQRAAVLVADAHARPAGRAEPANRHQHPLTIGNANLGAGHGAPPSGVSESASYQTASFAILKKAVRRALRKSAR